MFCHDDFSNFLKSFSLVSQDFCSTEFPACIKCPLLCFRL